MCILGAVPALQNISLFTHLQLFASPWPLQPTFLLMPFKQIGWSHTAGQLASHMFYVFLFYIYENIFMYARCRKEKIFTAAIAFCKCGNPFI